MPLVLAVCVSIVFGVDGDNGNGDNGQGDDGNSNIGNGDRVSNGDYTV
jgi:hypothetical protein